MAEYIEREAVCKNCNNLNICTKDGRCPVMRTTAADVEPVRHGRWVFKSTHDLFEEATCTACNGMLLVKWYDALSHYHYCPNCGAKMDLEVSE